MSCHWWALQELCSSRIMPDSHSPHHCGLLQQSEHPHSALAITKPRSKPNRTFVGRTGPMPQSAKCPPCNTRWTVCGAAGGLGDHPKTDDPAPDSLHAAQMPGGDPGKWRPHPVLIFRADNGVPAESKWTKSGQFDWSDTLLSRHYRRLLSYSFDFVNFERSNVT